MFKVFLKLVLLLKNFLGWQNSIDEPESLRSYVSSRSSYMAQVSLYGSLKARAGTRYISLIKDPLFASSMKTARDRIFFACMIDLTLHVLKTIHTRTQQNFKSLDLFACQFFIECLAKAPEEVFTASAFIAAALCSGIKMVCTPAHSAVLAIAPKFLTSVTPSILQILDMRRTF